MHITRYTDYALRVLIYLASKQGALSTIQEIADSYVISKNHLMKVVHGLNQKGYVDTVRGKHGGIMLSRNPELINIGLVVRDTENYLSLVECFSEPEACAITPACQLRFFLEDALAEFLAVLDRYTLADLIHRPGTVPIASLGLQVKSKDSGDNR